MTAKEILAHHYAFLFWAEIGIWIIFFSQVQKYLTVLALFQLFIS